MTVSKARQLVITVIDEWERLRYFHQLVEIMCEEDNVKTLILYSDCYIKLSEVHRQALEVALYKLKDHLDRLE